MVILLDPTEILFALNSNSILQVFLNPVISDDCVRPQSIFSKNMNSIFFVFLYFVHENIWVGRNRLDAHLALADFAELDLRFVSSLDFDSWTVHVSNVATEDLRL